MKRPANIIEAITNPEYFGKAFKDLTTWQAWLTFLRTVYGIPFADDHELTTFQECTKRTAPLVGGHKEIFAVCGRRGGKSRIMSTVAAFEALWGGWGEGLAPGENAFIFLIAFDKTQAGQLFRYTKGLLEPFMTKEDKNRITSDTIELKQQRTTIMVKAGQFQAVRGFSTAVILLDELGFARSDSSAQPVEELVAALTPSIMENGLLIGASTPFTPFGFFYEQYDQHFGRDDDEVLVWHGGTLRMNPSYSKTKIERDIRKDKARYESEYNATFRSDIESLLPKFMIESAMRRPDGVNREQMMPETGRRYEAFIDASSLRQDSFTMAIGYLAGEKAVVVRVEERTPPGDPGSVTIEYSNILKSYGIKSVRADSYAKGWVESGFRKQDIMVETADTPASGLYSEFVALLAMGRLELVRHDKLCLQLQQLERRVQPGGREQISHPEGGHDDIANSVSGLCVYLLRNRQWTEAEMDARLPIAQHGIPKEFERPEVAATRIRQSAEAELHDFMIDSGCNEIVKQGMRRPWTPPTEHKVGEVVTVGGGKA
jgi:hypothetical protein